MRVWLNKRRSEMGLTMKETAKKVGISESYYCQIENGVRNCTVQTARKIAAILDIDWQRFFPDCTADELLGIDHSAGEGETTI